MRDDYDELAYVDLEYVEGDGHVQVYIKSGNTYYMINPSSQFYMDYGNTWTLGGWMGEYTVKEIASSDSLDKLMESLIKAENPGTPMKTVKNCFTVITDNDWCMGGNSIRMYPKGWNVTSWTDSEYTFKTPTLDIESHSRKDAYNYSSLPEAFQNVIEEY